MVTKQSLIAWSKALLHAVIVPLALYGLAPQGWAFSLAYLVLTTTLYATALKTRPAARPFVLIAAIVALIAIPVLIGTSAFANAITIGGL